MKTIFVTVEAAVQNLKIHENYKPQIVKGEEFTFNLASVIYSPEFTTDTVSIDSVILLDRNSDDVVATFGALGGEFSLSGADTAGLDVSTAKYSAGVYTSNGLSAYVNVEVVDAE